MAGRASVGRGQRGWAGQRVYTVGHSTRALTQLLDILSEHDVMTIVDVRTVPRSRHNPQFNSAELARVLPPSGLGYVHIPGLGGLRHARRDSPNTAWRNASFRGYADYMQTDAFENALGQLQDVASEAGGPIAVMCAEAVPWRCHRSLIADALLARGAEVWHLTGVGRASRHRMTPFAHVSGTRVTYPGQPGELHPEPQPQP